MAALNQYLMDSLDFFDAYGYAVKSGSDDLLQLPKSKDVYAYSWGDQNGKQYDVSTRFFEDKTVTFSGHIIADSKTEFWQKYTALWAVLQSPGYRSIYSTELEQTFSCFYLESTNVKRFTRLLEFPESIAMELDLTFQVLYSELSPPDPGSNNSFPYTFPFNLA